MIASEKKGQHGLFAGCRDRLVLGPDFTLTTVKYMTAEQQEVGTLTYLKVTDLCIQCYQKSGVTVFKCPLSLNSWEP